MYEKCCWKIRTKTSKRMNVMEARSKFPPHHISSFGSSFFFLCCLCTPAVYIHHLPIASLLNRLLNATPPLINHPPYSGCNTSRPKSVHLSSRLAALPPPPPAAFGPFSPVCLHLLLRIDEVCGVGTAPASYSYSTHATQATTAYHCRPPPQ